VAISVQYKEYGIRLNFTPIVNGNRVHLKVAAGSEHARTLPMPSSSTDSVFRHWPHGATETELELNNGQTFAIAGPDEQFGQLDPAEDPRHRRYPDPRARCSRARRRRSNRPELVVMITPEILPNNSPGVTTQTAQAGRAVHAAGDVEEGPRAGRRPRSSRIRGAAIVSPIVPVASAAPATTNGSARDAAAAMSALTPNTRNRRQRRCGENRREHPDVGGCRRVPADRSGQEVADPRAETGTRAPGERSAHQGPWLDAKAAKGSAGQGRPDRVKRIAAALKRRRNRPTPTRNCRTRPPAKQAKRNAAEQKHQAELAKKQTSNEQKAQ